MRSLNQIYHSSPVLRRWTHIIRKDLIKFASTYMSKEEVVYDIQDTQRMNGEEPAKLNEIVKLVDWATNRALYSKVDN